MPRIDVVGPRVNTGVDEGRSLLKLFFLFFDAHDGGATSEGGDSPLSTATFGADTPYNICLGGWSGLHGGEATKMEKVVKVGKTN